MIRKLLAWMPFGRVPEISPEKLRELLESGERIELIDVRTRTEFSNGHIAGALSVPIHTLPRRIDELELDRSSSAIAICKTAHRSIPAVRLLRRRGFEAFQLAGGMDRWRELNFD